MPREPYSYEIVSEPLLGWPTINITCDDLVIRTVTMPVNIAEDLVALLNQVYLNGYMEGGAGL